MNIFQIPKLSSSTADKVIGVIDCSGSMESNWPWLADHWNRYVPRDNCITITFDTKAKLVEGNILDKNIYTHGGGGTNITTGFEMLEKELAKLPNKLNLTVLFISDGADNNLHTLEGRIKKLGGNNSRFHINFICLGVGSGFPTFVSLQLREKYHNGDETLPAIFLIEFVTEKAFTIKFEEIQKFFSFNKARKVVPPVCLFPWREYTSEPFENAWILTDADKLLIDGEEHNVAEYRLNMRGINELFRSWAQMMHLESLRDGEKLEVRAKKTFALMQSILDELKSAKGVDALAEDDDTKLSGRPFYDRVMLSRNRRELTRVKWFFNDIKTVAEGQSVLKEDQFEAAKRIGLGTIVGNFQQKVQALKNIKAEEFAAIKAEFKELLKTFPVQQALSKPESDFPALSGPHFRAVLCDKTLEKGLDLCQTQFDFFEAFELRGCPIRLNREKTEGSDPWELDAKFCELGQTIDSAGVLGSKGTTSVTLAQGRQETANAVLPLFTEQDSDLAPFVASRLFKLLLGYNCFLDADNIYNDVGFGLLGNCLMQVAKSEATRTQKQLAFEKIAQSVKLFDYGQMDSNSFAAQSLSLDKASLIFKRPQPDSSKRISFAESALRLVFAYQQGKTPLDKIADLVRFLISVLAFDSAKNTKANFTGLYDVTISQKETEAHPGEQLKQLLRAKFSEFYTTGDLKREIVLQINQAASTSELSASFLPARIERISVPRLNATDLIQLVSVFADWQPSPAELEQAIALGFCATSEADLLTPVDESKISAALNKLRALAKDHFKAASEAPKTKGKAPRGRGGKRGAKNKNAKINTKINASDCVSKPLYRELLVPLLKEFVTFFKQVHREIYPFGQEDFDALCVSKGIQKGAISLQKDSGLPQGVCGAPMCKFFLQKKAERLSHHTSIWGHELPRGYHSLVKQHCHLPAEEIYQLFLKKSPTKHDPEAKEENPVDFGRRKSETMAYITNLKSAYEKLSKTN